MTKRRALPFFAALLFVLTTCRTQRVFVSDRIEVETRGQGTPLVLIPGVAGHRDIWNSVADSLDDRYELHLVQVRGFAGVPAQANASGPVLAPLTEEIARYIREMDLGRPIVAGHSMGGTIGMMLAARHPDAVGCLMVLDMPPFLAVAFAGPTATVESARPIADQMRNQILTDRSVLRKQFEGMTRTESMRGVLTKSLDDSDPTVVANAFHELIVTDVRPELSRITAPMTVMYVIPQGIPIPADQYEQGLKASYTNASRARLVRVDDSNHFIQIDQPTRLVEEVNRCGK